MWLTRVVFFFAARLYCTVGVHPTRCNVSYPGYQVFIPFHDLTWEIENTWIWIFFPQEFDESGDPEKHFQALLSLAKEGIEKGKVCTFFFEKKKMNNHYFSNTLPTVTSLPLSLNLTYLHIWLVQSLLLYMYIHSTCNSQMKHNRNYNISFILVMTSIAYIFIYCSCHIY